jgi:hypothetical protein
MDELTRALPKVREWIDDLLARHRSKATRVSRLPFARLPHFYARDTLDNAFVVEVDTLPVPPLSALGLAGFEDFERMSGDGITYQDVYFVRSAQAHDEALHFHELVHIVQWRNLGAEQFTTTYALAHLLNGGYDDNPFEKIAYRLQGEFERGSQPFSVEPLVTQHLGEIVPALLAASKHRA